jgi:hypothetical protein
MVHMKGIQAGIQALSDATGLSQEEVWLKATQLVLATALTGLVRTVDFVTDVYAELKRPGFDA